MTNKYVEFANYYCFFEETTKFLRGCVSRSYKLISISYNYAISQWHLQTTCKQQVVAIAQHVELALSAALPSLQYLISFLLKGQNLEPKPPSWLCISFSWIRGAQVFTGRGFL
jgi:hypothetical protein